MIGLFKKQKGNVVASAVNLLKLLKVKVTESTISQTLMTNPNFPSLLSVTDSLQKWKVASAVYNVEPDKLSLLPLPFIAHLSTGSGSFVTVKEVSDSEVLFMQDDDTELRMSKDNFAQTWSGTVLLAEATTESGEQNYRSVRRRELLSALPLPALMLLILALGLFNLFSVPNYGDTGTHIFFYSIWGLKVAGLIVTGLLLLYEYDDSNGYLNKLCSATPKTDCKAVLKSKASRILGFSWSEMGFFYFAGSFAYLTFCGYSDVVTHPIIILDTIAVPYIIFSVYYQAFVAKQWCTFCLVIQFILLLQFALALSTSQFSQQLFSGWQQVPYILLIAAFAIPFLSWLIFKPYLYESRDSQKTRSEYLRFKNNGQVFNGLLQNQRAITTNPAGLGITLGNPDAENTLIKVCNPYCGPCAQSFPQLGPLFNVDGNKWKVQIIFTAAPEKSDYRALPVAHFLAMKDRLRDSEAVNKFLGDWYNADNKNFDSFVAKYPLVEQFEERAGQIADMRDWCNAQDIQFTPSYFVNGHALPETYNLEDLKDIF